jgi:hypothetical protein
MFFVFIKKSFLLLVMSIIIAFYSNLSYAANGTPSSYIVTVNSMDLCEDAACTNFTRIGASSKQFDIAAAAASADVGTYVDEIVLVVGTEYTHVRWNLNRSFSMTGTVAIGGVGNCATATNGTAGTETVNAYTAVGQTEAALSVFMTDLLKGGDGSWPLAADYTSKGVQLVSNDFPSATTFDYIKQLEQPYTVSEEVPEISMSFNVTNNLGAGYNNSGGAQNGVPNAKCYYWVKDPSPTISIK